MTQISKVEAAPVDEIVDEIEWKKIIGATVLVLGLIHLLYFWHPVCNRDERML